MQIAGGSGQSLPDEMARILRYLLFKRNKMKTICSLFARFTGLHFSALLVIAGLSYPAPLLSGNPPLTAPLAAGPACKGDLKINEIRAFSTEGPEGDFLFSFVEIYNSSNHQQSLKNWRLFNGQGDMIAALPSWKLPARSALRVCFGSGTDDSDFSDGEGIYYTMGDSIVFDQAADEVALYFGKEPLPKGKHATANGLKDYAAWSANGAYPGGIFHQIAVDQGLWPAGAFVDVSGHGVLSAFGLCPDGYDHNDPDDWREYDWGPYFAGSYRAAPNPIQTAPLHGAADDGPVSLEWAARNNATGYRLQIADDESFDKPLVNTVVAGTTFLADLPGGVYYWRVRVIDETCGEQEPAAVWQFGLIGAQGADGAPVLLNVPQRYQRKDTRLLCLSFEPRHIYRQRPGCSEAADPWGPWDGEHPNGHALGVCAHCANYCARACNVMVNHYFGGDMSQDRVSYEIFKNYYHGPEIDFGHGSGFRPQQTIAGLFYSLIGVSIGYYEQQLPFDSLVSRINAGRPVLFGNGNHQMVISGYRILDDGTRLAYVRDPWPSGKSGWFLFNTLRVVKFWLLYGNITGRIQEPEIKTDADGDGAVDFDEQKRFCSHYQQTDTDRDEVPDKQEIRSYTFHDWDHVHDNDPLPFPDIDGDGTYAECDCDSDNDADFDGGEDLNGDGSSPIGASETCVYDKDDKLVFIATNKQIYLAGENVELRGNSHHANSTYPYEIKSGCPDLSTGDALGRTGDVTTLASGAYTQNLGGFQPGQYLVVLDILKDQLYQEPDNWDPWTCFLVIPCLILIDPFIIPASAPAVPDGAIDLSVSDGAPPYVFLWSNGAATEDLAGIPAGIYTVIVSDQEGCSRTAEIVVPVCSMELQLTVQPVTFPGGSDGAIDLTVTGGTPPFGYLWSNGATTEDLLNIPQGPYSVQVNDVQGCIQFAETFVSESSSNARPTETREASFGEPGFRIFPNPARDWMTVQFSNDPAATRYLSVSNTLGQTVLNQETAGQEARIQTGRWPAGIYRLEVSDSRGRRAALFVVSK